MSCCCEYECRKGTDAPHTHASELAWTEEQVVQQISEAFDRGVAVGESAAREQVLKKAIQETIEITSKPSYHSNDCGYAIQGLRAEIITMLESIRCEYKP